MDFETTRLFDDSPNDPMFNCNRCSESARERTQRLENILSTDGNWHPRITEMAFVSVSRALFIESLRIMNNRHLLLEDCAGIEPVPIVANVHTRQLNPQLSEHEWTKYEEMQRQLKNIRLRRTDLAEKNTFAQEWPGVFHLLQTARKPACLVAHNGINFDFRLLYHELRNNDLLDTYPIPEQVFFLDSLLCFYELEKEYNRELEVTTNNVDWKLVLSCIQSARNVDKATGEHVPNSEQNANNKSENTDLLLMQQATEKMEFVLGKQRTSCIQRGSIQQITPTKNDIDNDEAAVNAGISKTAKRSLFRAEMHPIQFMHKKESSPAKRRFVDADFFERNNRGEWSFNGNQVRRLLVGRGNFKLENMYKRLISSPLNFHRAQSDCEALLQICLSYGMDFINFMDRHSSSFPTCFRPSKN